MKSMKIVVKIITFGLLIYVGLHFLGEYIAQYSEESFRVRTGIYALKDKEGWSEEECNHIVKQKEDSLLDAYFPIISVLFI